MEYNRQGANKARDRRRVTFMGLAAATVMTAVTAVAAALPGPDPSSDGMTPVGATAKAIVEVGDMYGSPEMYDVGITVLELARGDKAMDLIPKASPSNKPPDGYEYLLARIRFQFSARGAPGDKILELKSDHFSAFSSGGNPYETVSVVPPEQRLAALLHSGDSVEGWMAFLVAKNDEKPFMTFSRAGCWFQLY